MKYYKFQLNNDNKVSKKYRHPNGFFYLENGTDIWFDEVYKRYQEGERAFFIRYADNKGAVPELDSVGSQEIIILASVLENCDFNYPELTMIPVTEKESGAIYHALWFKEYADCVNWEHSEYDPWDKGDILQPWHNPRGRWFWRAALDEQRIPPNLNMFKLQDWGGAFNLVINENVKQKIDSLQNALVLTNFMELPVYRNGKLIEKPVEKPGQCFWR
jgi:hypothetical protein